MGAEFADRGGRVPLQLHHEDDREVLAHLGRLDDRDVGGDDPVIAVLADAAQDGRGRQGTRSASACAVAWLFSCSAARICTSSRSRA